MAVAIPAQRHLITDCLTHLIASASMNPSSFSRELIQSLKSSKSHTHSFKLPCNLLIVDFYCIFIGHREDYIDSKTLNHLIDAILRRVSLPSIAGKLRCPNVTPVL